MNYSEVANNILKKIGGKENVNNLTHCLTRLRFELNDSSVADIKEIESIEGVMKAVDTGAQFQVVIGNKVKEVYFEVMNSLDGETLSEDKQETKKVNVEKSTQKKVKLFDKFAAMISGIFAPTLGIMAGTGMLKGLLSIFLVTKVLSADSSTYKVLYSISDTVFYFFPIILGGAAANYFKMNQYIGLTIGAAMLYPTILEIASKQNPVQFIGLPMNILNYSNTVFPVIIAVLFASKLYKQCEKYLPSSIRIFATSLIVLVVTLPLTYFIIGPAITTLSSVLSKVLMSAYNFSPILGGLVLGGPWILIVLFGLHWAFIPIFISDIVTNGSSPLLGLLTANQFAMTGAAIAIAIVTKDKKKKELAWSTGGTCLIGVAEPLIYSLLLPMKKPLIMSIIGGSIGGAIAGFAKSKLYGLGGSGLLQIPMILNPKGADLGFYGGLIACIVALGVGFILTYLFGLKDKEQVQ